MGQNYGNYNTKSLEKSYTDIPSFSVMLTVEGST